MMIPGMHGGGGGGTAAAAAATAAASADHVRPAAVAGGPAGRGQLRGCRTHAAPARLAAGAATGGGRSSRID